MKRMGAAVVGLVLLLMTAMLGPSQAAAAPVSVSGNRPSST